MREGGLVARNQQNCERFHAKARTGANFELMVAWDAPVQVTADDGVTLRAPTPGEVFDQRMDHIMWFDNDKEGDWKAWLPFLKRTQEQGAPLRWGVTAADLAITPGDSGCLSYNIPNERYR